MDKEQIFNEVVGIIKDYVKDPARLENVNMETSILEDLKVNSARLVDIIIAFEDTFDVEIEDDDADNIRTIGDAVNYIAGKVGTDQAVK